MDQVDELNAWKARVFQLIGENVLIFQQMECLLKDLLPRATISISPEIDAAAMLALRKGEVELNTLGTLVKRFITEVCNPADPNPENHVDRWAFTSSIRLGFVTDEGRDAMSSRLESLVEDRNRMIHHFLPEVTADSAESWCVAFDTLEDLKKRALSEVDRIRDLVGMLEMGRDLITNPDIQAELTYGPTRHLLIEKLKRASASSNDHVGWIPLRSALRSEGPPSSEAITELVSRYGVPNVSTLLESLGCFEIRHEKDSKGTCRTFYRVIEVPELQIIDDVVQPLGTITSEQ